MVNKPLIRPYLGGGGVRGPGVGHFCWPCSKSGFNTIRSRPLKPIILGEPDYVDDVFLRRAICARVDQLPWHFHIIGDKLINPIVGVYIPIIRIPIKRWDDHPQYCDFWPWHIWNLRQCGVSGCFSTVGPLFLVLLQYSRWPFRKQKERLEIIGYSWVLQNDYYILDVAPSQ